MAIDWIKVTGAAQDGYGYVETEKACRRRDRTADAIVAALKELERQTDPDAPAAVPRRPEVGDRVRYVGPSTKFNEPGDLGTIARDDASTIPYLVRWDTRYSGHWSYPHEIEVIS